MSTLTLNVSVIFILPRLREILYEYLKNLSLINLKLKYDYYVTYYIHLRLHTYTSLYSLLLIFVSYVRSNAQKSKHDYSDCLIHPINPETNPKTYMKIARYLLQTYIS